VIRGSAGLRRSLRHIRVTLAVPKPQPGARDVGIAVGLAVLLMGGSLALLGVPGPVPVQMVSTGGPNWISNQDPPKVLASASLTELASLVQAVPSWPPTEQCKNPRFAWMNKLACWDISTLPSNSLLLAVILSPGGGCLTGKLQGAVLSIRTLTVTDQLAGFSTGTPNCGGGGGYALAALPLSRLPTGNITVVIQYVGFPPNCRCSVPDARATVNIPWHLP
jgi:hypothetical protein